MDLRSIINTENASNSDSSSSNHRPPAHDRPTFAPPPPPAAPATPYASSRDSQPASARYDQHQQHHPSIDSLTSPSSYTPQSQSANPAIHQQPQQQPSVAPQRSHSIQSVLSSDPPSYPYYPRDHSPVAPSHPLPSQQFSPHAQGSLPGTPLGPPPASFARNSPSSSVRPQSSGHESQSNQPSSPWVRHDSHGHDQRPFISPTAQSRHAWQDSRSVEQPARQQSIVSEREQENSVSPKTASTPGIRHESSAGPRQSEERVWKDSPTRSLSYSSQQQQPLGPGTHQADSIQTDDRSQPRPSKMDIAPDATASSSPHPPERKRKRYNEPPIYAQRSIRARGTGPIIPNPLPPIPKHARDSPSNPWFTRIRSSSASESSRPALAQEPIAPENHVDEATPTNGPPPAHPPAPEPPQAGSLGPWEPSITGFIPHEDVTKIVCDFLFQHVVLRNDVGAGPAGSSAAGQGAIIEVEAKLGRHIDMDRGDRLFLPVMTESILNREASRFRTSFESSMSLAQHRIMNNFLNEAVKASMPHSNPGRVPLSYAHKKERDTFYEVPPSDLPPVIRQNLNPRHKPRVRITTDQRTGETLAKIVKCRVADLDILSPRTCVDYRISVNLEMSYEGDVSHLPVVDSATGGGKARDRNKDRMSYRHLAYQVDLTQVARSEGKNEFDHELEIEVSAAEIRRQGHLAMAGDPQNQYEDLIKGFVDNIRVLARAVPP